MIYVDFNIYLSRVFFGWLIGFVFVFNVLFSQDVSVSVENGILAQTGVI